MCAMPPTIPMCLHCEARPQSVHPLHSYLRLCDDCAAVTGLRKIYKKKPGWTPAYDARIQALADRAKQGLSLFPPAEPEPTPPLKRRSILLPNESKESA